MTFQDLADTLGLSAGGIRVLFCQKKWSIHSVQNVREFLATRFSNQKTKRVRRPHQTGAHLKKWRFVKKIKQVEISPAEEKLARKSALTAAKERKNAAVARVAVAEKSAKQTEKIRILEEKLKQNEALVAAKERKIASLTRQNTRTKDKGQRIKNKEENDSIPKVEVVEQGRERKPSFRETTEKPEPQIVKNPTPDFGTVPSAESRKAAARARRKEKEGRERKSSFRETEESRERKPLPRVPEAPIVENIVEEVGDENLRPATPVEAAKTPEIKAEQAEHNPPTKGGDPTPQRRVGGSAGKQQKSLNSVPSSPDPSVLRTSPLGRGETNLPVETLTTEITALRTEIREQIGKIEIAEEEVFAEIPTEQPVAETVQSRIEPQIQQTIEKIEPQILEQPTPEPEPNIVIPAQAGTQKTPETPETPEIKAETDTESAEITLTEIETPAVETVAEPVEAETPVQKIKPEVVEAVPVEVAPEPVPVEKVEAENTPQNSPN